MNIPIEAIDAATKAILREFAHDENAGYMARLALESAAPFIAAEAWDEGFITAEDEARYHHKSPNPYRKASK